MTDAATVIHPALVLIAGGLLLPWLRGALRSVGIVALPLVVLALVWQVPDGAVWRLHWLDYTLAPLQGDKLSRLFATIFAPTYAPVRVNHSLQGGFIPACQQAHSAPMILLYRILG